MTQASSIPPGSADAPDLDLTVLERLVGGDAAKLRKFALLFLQSVGDVLNQIDDALVADDLEALAGLGHRAKSTSMNVGAAGFSRQCLALETAARQQDRSTAVAIARGLRPLLEDIRAVIGRRFAA